MKIHRDSIFRILVIFGFDMIISIYLIIIYFYFKNNKSNLDFLALLIIGTFVLIILRIGIFLVGRKKIFINRLDEIKKVIAEYKKGKFFHKEATIKGNDPLTKIYKELISVGKYLDEIVSSQKNEIDSLNEFYKNIVFSMNSLFIVLNNKNNIIFTNDEFIKKFELEEDSITGKNLGDIFYFVNAKLKGAVDKATLKKETIILEKTHLLSKNKISIIANIKISNISVQGKEQIIIIIDDVTTFLQKDYQLSVMTKISNSIQKDEKIERLLETILSSITSGEGLGFNRAMLFLVKGKNLIGKMAIGSDSMDEAIKVWSSINSSKDNRDEDFESFTNTGEQLKLKVTNAKFKMKDDNILIKALRTKETIHVYDLYNDENIDDEIKELIDSREFIIVPLVSVEKSIGVIIADNKFNQTPISNESKELVKIFASQAGVSIDSHSNLEITKKEMEKLENKQDAIIESEKMAAVGRIAAHIAHEIRNPLVTMGGYARRILSKHSDNPKSNKTIIKSAEIILKESERLEKILSNVMDFTRPSTFIKDFNNTNDFIHDTINLLKNMFLERGIHITLNLSNELPLIKADFNLMKQVMLNLLQNSIDATPPEGHIDISTNLDEEKNIVIIKLTDSGSGINEENVNIIFEPFFTTKVTGVGLGLANVKKIITDHKGNITVKNREKEEGVEFIITLPLPI